MTTISATRDDAAKIVFLTIDSDGPVNVIDGMMMGSLERALGGPAMRGARGVILRSAKKGSFITGADMQELFGGGPDALEASLRKMDSLLLALSGLEIPVAAVLDDQAAVGGGFELLLRCCDRIFAAPRTSFGLPEVHFGLVPALGGIHPLARAAGLEEALNLVFRGRSLRTGELAAAGLTVSCGSAELEREAVKYIEGNPEKPARVKDPGSLPVRPENPDERKEIIAAYAGRAGASPQRPWLPAAVRLFEKALEGGFGDFMSGNIKEFLSLSGHPNTRNKIDFYFLKTFVFPKAVRIEEDRAARCDRIGVIGSGLMGSGIAQMAADSGIAVKLLDVDEKIARAAVEKVSAALGGLVKKGRWTKERMERCMENLRVAGSLEELGDVPLVIEAAPENMELKKKLVGDVHGLGEEIIFATNTSSLPVGDISSGSPRPDRVVGMHFFSPVPLMELLEVVEGRETSRETVATAMLLGRTMGKTCILVGDGPGFYTSRVFASFLYGGFHAVECGADPWEVDRTAVKAGFPRGPLHMFCSVGGMIPYHAGTFMETRDPVRFPVPANMKKAAEAGFVGAGGERGFYKDEAGREPDRSVLEHMVRREGVPAPSGRDVEDILLLGMVNEAFQVMGEGILRDFPSMDIGAVLGVGFPDCFHGPARYAGMRGIDEVLSRLSELHETYRIPHLKPASELVRLEACGVRNNLV